MGAGAQFAPAFLLTFSGRIVIDKLSRRERRTRNMYHSKGLVKADMELRKTRKKAKQEAIRSDELNKQLTLAFQSNE